jgi:hypothetical protein
LVVSDLHKLETPLPGTGRNVDTAILYPGFRRGIFARGTVRTGRRLRRCVALLL